MSETTRDRGLSVTIKYGKGYEETWAVFQGSPADVREDIIAYFGFERDSVAGLTLNSLVVNATQAAHGNGLIAAQLGGVVVSEEPSASTAKQEGDPWAQAAGAKPAGITPTAPQQPAADPNAWILAEIAKQTNVADLKKLWAENQAMFADATVMAAWKAKGKALSA
ncbi:hypothetical protein [Streptomyces sp. NBC_01198]|uniref:hypothetical protein n=1 Tax=Streptomyces sp. NBC_01198 TaxID=2903769 RepID=UPI002E1192A7|nr:hypothetical protein OG702_31945 [Streptomyces sp. NBC_01198]